jgi:hypothetical protein
MSPKGFSSQAYPNLVADVGADNPTLFLQPPDPLPIALVIQPQPVARLGIWALKGLFQTPDHLVDVRVLFKTANLHRVSSLSPLVANTRPPV